MNGEYSSRDSGRSREHYSSRGDRDDRRDRDRDRRDRGDRDRDGHRERRRSRSPHHGSRRSGRDLEDDNYSSSRDYRAREREDRYSHRRDDREWDRDRGDRRRREDDRRPPRRERDLFDDRRGAGRDREGISNPTRRSRSPPPKKREPTPDLTDIVSVLERKRRLTQWDIKPPGYENVTAEQAKLSGMFPLPGAPRQQPMDPSKLQAFMNQPAAAASTSALKPSMARQSKRLFVYNVPHSVSEDSLVAFFNLQMNGLNVVNGIDPCISASMSTDGSYALVEFRNPSDATVALAFDGIEMPEHAENGTNGNANGNGASKGLNIRRPKDYIVPSAEESDYSGDGVSTTVPDTANKISISNIPPYLNDEQITELLVSFGDLKAFTLIKDTSTEESRGVAFCEYADPAATTIAVEGLNEMELGDRKLKVQLASIGFQQAAGLEMGVNAMSMFAGMTSTGLEEGRVLQLLNMVTAEELIDNDEYEEIKEDILEECQKYGTVLEVKIPRPSGGSRQSAGVGKIYVKFDSNDSAKKALQALAGRKFADRTVVTTYYSEESFDVSAW